MSDIDKAMRKLGQLAHEPVPNADEIINRLHEMPEGVGQVLFAVLTEHAERQRLAMADEWRRVSGQPEPPPVADLLDEATGKLVSLANLGGTLCEANAQMAAVGARPLFEYQQKYANASDGRREGGRKGGGHNRVLDPERVLHAFNQMSQPERNRAGILAKRYGVTSTAVRTALRKAKGD